ncbi:MAG: hypothetical protein DMF68_08010 [Acidobacteria bacterium]|nr:MAG: hypothetical protein DMF68_08010 [Acidobacteriota bacterium]
MWSDLAVALILFAATAAVVVWQNSRLGVLWDASYILENSFRISAGDVPYRDFPFPYAPLTFLAQAAIIKLTGRVFWHHIAYCASVGGLSTVLAWRILLNIPRGIVAHARLLAFVLSAPLVVLGVYCIYPHPFYDPDCTFAILACILLLQLSERRASASWLAFLTGVAIAIPLFIKQNTGLGFLFSAVVLLIALMVVEVWNKRSVRRYVWLLTGVVAGLAAALLIIQLTAGLNNYVHWTIRFAAARRAPPLSDMLEIYKNVWLLLWLAGFALGIVLWRLNRKGNRALAILSACLMILSFAWAVVYLFVDSDPSEQAERLLAVWPFVLVVSTVFALLSLRRRTGVALVLPFILIGTIHGAFLSQQLWGSTYAIWPLLLILVASTITDLFYLKGKERAEKLFAWLSIPLATLVALSLMIAGARYVWTSERLGYANLSEGEMQRSKLPALKGLSVRGSWISDFEELVDYSEKNIPREDGILMLPGEDLFYYTTGRRPRFPVLMFDHTVNPYSAQEILELARAKNINWLIVKGDLQLEDDQVDADKDQMLKILEQDFKQVESLNNYDIYRRKTGNEDEDEDEDENDEGSSDER